ncbi:SRPBCC family protein [Psychromonas sp. Urea-02u-13]|uniref:SRPBCC family protein n=1 Tax=Psychromonas sp. Urea-02u-13 TaxID=2058326 RepID=UPI0012FE8EBD|nr:SRPBCC domain-containing protein [Psychromonas sp. Urea-02u-13]
MQKLSIKQSIVINAPAHAIYQALTRSEQIPLYFPIKLVISKWRVGESVEYKGEINGLPFTDYGVIEKLVPNVCYQYRYWSDNHGTQQCAESYVTICYQLQVVNHQVTRLLMTQDNLVSEEMLTVMDEIVWPQLLTALKNHVQANYLKSQITVAL